MTGVLIRGNLDTNAQRRCEDTVTYKPRRAASEETNPDDNLISDFQPPEL